MAASTKSMGPYGSIHFVESEQRDRIFLMGIKKEKQFATNARYVTLPRHNTTKMSKLTSNTVNPAPLIRLASSSNSSGT